MTPPIVRALLLVGAVWLMATGASLFSGEMIAAFALWGFPLGDYDRRGRPALAAALLLLAAWRTRLLWTQGGLMFQYQFCVGFALLSASSYFALKRAPEDYRRWRRYGSFRAKLSTPVVAPGHPAYVVVDTTHPCPGLTGFLRFHDSLAAPEGHEGHLLSTAPLTATPPIQQPDGVWRCTLTAHIPPDAKRTIDDTEAPETKPGEDDNFPWTMWEITVHAPKSDGGGELANFEVRVEIPPH